MIRIDMTLILLVKALQYRDIGTNDIFPYTPVSFNPVIQELSFKDSIMFPYINKLYLLLPFMVFNFNNENNNDRIC